MRAENHIVTGLARRSFIKIGNSLAVDFANTVYGPGEEDGALHSWRDLVDFLDLRGGVSRPEAERLRAMGESDARRCAKAFAQALELRDTVRAMLGAMAAKRQLRASWIHAVNRGLASGIGGDRLLRQDGGWLLAFVPAATDPLRALAPIAHSMAQLVEQGNRASIRNCANPACVLYFCDTSRTRRRRWCSMAVCGNRMKVAAHARRRRGRPRSK